jgi:hypothetical protein
MPASNSQDFDLLMIVTGTAHTVMLHMILQTCETQKNQTALLAPLFAKYPFSMFLDGKWKMDQNF